MNFFAVAGLTVAVLGLPPVWIALRANRTARRAASFDAVWDYVDSHQADLRLLAWSTSPVAWRSEVVPMLVRTGWLLDQPIPLERVTLKWQTEVFQDAGGGKRWFGLPLNDSIGGYHSYSKALTARAGKNQLFNGLIYRPVDVKVTPRGLQLTFTKGRYFDYLDTSEVLAFELGARLHSHKSNPADGPRRRAVTDPCDLSLRATSFGVNTLTIRKDVSGQHGFFMHKRSGSNVVNESDLIHVVPAGEFTPSDVSYEAIGADFSLWRNVMREYAEEFLNKEEAYGQGGQPLDYDNDPPYAQLSAAKQNGGLHISVFGVAIEALCLKPELLTVCVFEANVFDRIFADMVSVDSEGVLLVGSNRKGIPFTHTNVQLYADNSDTTSAGVACLKLAWRHRRELGLLGP
jgi:hypothetical protein